MIETVAARLDGVDEVGEGFFLVDREGLEVFQDGIHQLLLVGARFRRQLEVLFVATQRRRG